MRFNDLLHLVATLAPRLDRGDSLGRRMGDLRHPVSLQQTRCQNPVRFPSSQTSFNLYISLSAAPPDPESRDVQSFPICPGYGPGRWVRGKDQGCHQKIESVLGP